MALEELQCNQATGCPRVTFDSALSSIISRMEGLVTGLKSINGFFSGIDLEKPDTNNPHPHGIEAKVDLIDELLSVALENAENLSNKVR